MTSPNKHVDRRRLADYASDALDTEEAAEVRAHVEKCASCTGDLDRLHAFVADLDESWNRERLKATGAVHPSSAQLEALWMEEGAAEDLEIVRRHVSECRPCAEQMKRLEEGLAMLMQDDPLNASETWAAKISHKFAAGMEVVVDATHGAFTSAAGLVRDVMTPQARMRLAPSYAVSMGEGGAESEAGDVWHDAVFNTDDLSGELTGSVDSKTGRGVVTVMINKRSTYLGVPPLVDLFDKDGNVITSQYALDAGDRYTAQFRNLSEGRYLVGIHEPGE